MAVDFRRYFSSMNCGATVGGTFVNRCDRTAAGGPNFTAGGAVDQYISASAVLAVTMGGAAV